MQTTNRSAALSSFPIRTVNLVNNVLLNLLKLRAVEEEVVRSTPDLLNSQTGESGSLIKIMATVMTDDNEHCLMMTTGTTLVDMTSRY